jgi:hypothetical protein
MNGELPVIYLARHGETAWTVSGQHTGLTDLPLTPNGERNARRLGERLKKLQFSRCLQALCNGHRALASSRALERQRKRNRLWWSGTTGNTRGCGRPRFWQDARIGISFGTAAPGANLLEM